MKPPPYCDLNPADDEKFLALLQAATDQIDKINSSIPEVKQELLEALERKEASLLSKDFTSPKTEELIFQLEQYEEYQKAVNAEIVKINNVFADYLRNLSEDFINKKMAALQGELYSKNIIFLRGNYSEEINEIIKIVYNIDGKDEEFTLDELESSNSPQCGQHCVVIRQSPRLLARAQFGLNENHAIVAWFKRGYSR